VAWSVVSSSRHNVEGTFVLRSTCVLVMQVDAPGGVLLHGEPGTGKTLMVRALVEECSRLAGTPVAFFSRKGADCLGTLPLPALRHLSPNYSARSDGPRYRPRRERERERVWVHTGGGGKAHAFKPAPMRASDVRGSRPSYRALRLG
jgi:hypothetical protein